ncbi:hypothetical protein M5D96_004961, partial [Drosophila gunungcola]
MQGVIFKHSYILGLYKLLCSMNLNTIKNSIKTLSCVVYPFVGKNDYLLKILENREKTFILFR